jgi:hypothetical protein
MEGCTVCEGIRAAILSYPEPPEICEDCGHLYIPGAEDCACGDHGDEEEEEEP